MYLALARPHIGYAAQIWSPQSIDLTLKTRKNSAKGLKMYFKPTIQQLRRLQFKATVTESLACMLLAGIFALYRALTFWRIQDLLLVVVQSVLPHVRSTKCMRSTNTYIVKYDVPKCRTTTYQHSFTIRVTRIWNLLANHIRTLVFYAI